MNNKDNDNKAGFIQKTFTGYTRLNINDKPEEFAKTVTQTASQVKLDKT